MDYGERIVREYTLNEKNSTNTRKVMGWVTLKVAKAVDDGYDIEKVTVLPGDKDTRSRLIIEGYK